MLLMASFATSDTLYALTFEQTVFVFKRRKCPVSVGLDSFLIIDRLVRNLPNLAPVKCFPNTTVINQYVEQMLFSFMFCLTPVFQFIYVKELFLLIDIFIFC